MALGDNTLQSARGNTQRGRNPYMVQTVLNLATALSDKGSALAASDVIPVIAVPKGNMVLNAGIEVDTASDGSTFTVDLGMVDADVFVDGFDADAASAGDYAATPAAFNPVIVPAADTLDILVAAQTGTTLTGKFRVFATLMDISGQAGLGADEVDRDTLA